METTLKMRRYPSSLVALLMALLLPCASSAQIQDNIPSEDNPWYEVNIVIFKQPQHLLQSEQWKAGDELSLTLPRHLVSLEDPEAQTEDNETENLDTTPEPETAPTESSLPEENIVELPTAFLVQEATDEEFLETVNRLTRSPNYDILYQKSWLQPGLDKDTALPILIQAGEEYDGQYELEGTTTLHVARYLHLASKLWLSKYVQQLEVIKPWWQEGDDSNTDNVEEFANDTFTIQLGENPLTEQPSSVSPSFGMGNPMDSNTLAMGETITRYKSIRTGVLEESRRMRSGELHYIDHPLFGMVVKITPYELPEPEEEETAEGEPVSEPATATPATTSSTTNMPTATQ